MYGETLVHTTTPKFARSGHICDPFFRNLQFISILETLRHPKTERGTTLALARCCFQVIIMWTYFFLLKQISDFAIVILDSYVTHSVEACIISVYIRLQLTLGSSWMVTYRVSQKKSMM